jgi:hypothetical protein
VLAIVIETELLLGSHNLVMVSIAHVNTYVPVPGTVTMVFGSFSSAIITPAAGTTVQIPVSNIPGVFPLRLNELVPEG